MKKLSFLAISLVFAVASSSAMAIGNNGLVTLTDSMVVLNPIFRVIETTPGGQQIPWRGQVKWYVGKSWRTCHDLQLVDTEDSGDIGLSITRVVAFNSSMLVRAIGPGATCMRIDITNSGKFFSTGSVLLAWKEDKSGSGGQGGRYVKALPSTVRIDDTN